MQPCLVPRVSGNSDNRGVQLEKFLFYDKQSIEAFLSCIYLFCFDSIECTPRKLLLCYVNATIAGRSIKSKQ